MSPSSSRLRVICSGLAVLSFAWCGSACNTYMLWRDTRSRHTEPLTAEALAPAVWIDADGENAGLVCDPSAEARRKLHRLLPSTNEARWLLIEPAEYPETFFALAFPPDDDYATATWIEHADGSAPHLELVQRGSYGSYQIDPLPARRTNYPTLYGPSTTLRIRCRARWIEPLSPEETLPSNLRFGLALEQVQDDDAGPIGKLALTPLTLAVDLPLLPFQILGIQSWTP
jgi:hypothetical protein